MDNVVERLVVQLVGDLTDLAENGAQAQEIIDRITAGQENLAETIQEVNSVVEQQTEVQTASTNSVQNQIDTQSIVNDVFGESRALLQGLTGDNQDFANALGATNQAAENQEITQENLNESLDTLRGMLARAQQASHEVNTEYTRMAQELEEIDRRNAALRNLADGLGRLPGPAGDATRSVRGMIASVQAFLTASGPMLPAVVALGAAFTAIVGPAAAVYLAYRKLNREMEELDRVAKKAESLGDSVDNLQSLSFALKEIAGMSAGQTEGALMRLQRAVGSAAEGAGEGSKAFTKLGLDVQQLNRMTPTEQFRAVADAIQDYGSQAEKARISQQLFGRGSQEIILALTAQRDALEESEEWARKYGLTISSVDSESIQRANDALGRVGDAIGGWITQLAAEFAPLFEVIANHLLSWIPPATMFNDAMRFVVDLATVMLGILTDVGKVIAGAAKILMGDFSEGFELMKEGFSAESATQFLYESEQARQEAQKAAEEKERQRGIQQELNRELEKQAQLEKQATNYVEELRKQYEFMAQEQSGEKNKKLFEMQRQNVDPEIIKAAKDFESKIAEIEERRRVTKENLNQIAQEGLAITQEIERATKRGLALDEQYKSEQEKAIDRAAELKDLLDRGLIRPETFQKGIEELNSGLNQATDEANRFWEAMNGPQMSQFGRGREGLEESLIGIRGEARGSLLESQGMRPDLAKAEGMRVARQEGTNRRSEVDQKLISVLDLLQQRLSKGEDPNTLKLQVIEDLS